MIRGDRNKNSCIVYDGFFKSVELFGLGFGWCFSEVMGGSFVRWVVWGGHVGGLGGGGVGEGGGGLSGSAHWSLKR